MCCALRAAGHGPLAERLLLFDNDHLPRIKWMSKLAGLPSRVEPSRAEPSAVNVSTSNGNANPLGM